MYDTLYHCVSSQFRESVLLHGIDWRIGIRLSGRPNHTADYRPNPYVGNYLLRKEGLEHFCELAQRDVWQVDVRGLDIRGPLKTPIVHNHIYWTPNPIPPDRLTLYRPSLLDIVALV
jgi:hypothetical protein